jgi:hypothetical protein
MTKNKELYKEFKSLLEETDVDKCFDDKYAFAYIEQEVKLSDGGVFVSFRTGYNTDQVISFVKNQDGIFVKSYYRKNYGGYTCRCYDGKIYETINYGFGSICHNLYDLQFNLLNSTKEQSYGCCCG